MKFYILLALFFAAVLGENKINLEDIERDNLRSEAKTREEPIRAEETKYSASPDSAPDNVQYQYQYQYQPQQLAQGQSNQPLEVKYSEQQQQEIYDQGAKYSGNEIAYQQQQEQQEQQHQHQQQNAIPSGSAENVQPVQYYRTYQQPEVAQKSTPQPQFVYQPEVAVGNQLQTIQQKTVAEKYVQSVNKDAAYVNVPRSQLVSYYPNLAIGANPKGQVQPLLHRIAPQAAQNIALPVYTPALAQSQLQYQVQPQYQVTYAPRYPQPAKAVYTTKVAQNLAPAAPASRGVYAQPQAYYAGQFYAQQPSYYPQQNNLAYTQAYFPQSQLQYVREPIYNQHNSLYANVFAANPAAYAQQNAVAYAQGNQYYLQPQKFELPKALAEELTKHILEQQSSQSIAQSYAKIPQANFALPQFSGKNYNSGVTRLVPSQNHIVSAGPKSLLDSYVPSNLIVAQDAARYRERPLQLEGGFLPSKGAFAHPHSKRKAA